MFLPAKSGTEVMPGVGQAHLQGAGALEDLGDVGDLGAGLAGGEGLGHPGDGEVDVAVGQLRLRDDLDAAFHDRHVEAHRLVVTLIGAAK